MMDYIDTIGPQSPQRFWTEKKVQKIQDIVTLRNLKTKMLIHISKNDYLNIQRIVDIMIYNAEESGAFKKTSGYTGVEIPLTGQGRCATLSIRKSIVGKLEIPKYEWMLEKQ